MPLQMLVHVCILSDFCQDSRYTCIWIVKAKQESALSCRLMITATGFDGRLVHAVQHVTQLDVLAAPRNYTPTPGTLLVQASALPFIASTQHTMKVSLDAAA